MEDLVQEAARLGCEFLVRPRRHAKVLDMQEMRLPHAPVLGERRLVRVVGRRRILQANQRDDALGMSQGEVVDRKGAEIQAGKYCALHSDMIEQPQQVASDVINVVG